MAKRKKRRKAPETPAKKRKAPAKKSGHTHRVTKRRDTTRKVTPKRESPKARKVKPAPKVRKSPAPKSRKASKTPKRGSQKTRSVVAKKPARKAPKKSIPKSQRSLAAKIGWQTRNARSILATAKILPSLFKKVKAPQSLPNDGALRRASFATYRKRHELLKDPTIETLRELAADDDNDIEIEDDVYFNPFWYH